MGAFESGTAFLAGVIAKLPVELQAQAKELFEKPEAKDAVNLVGDGALARPDYSKAMNDLKMRETELQDKFTNLNQWFDVNKGALEEYKATKAELDALKAGDPADPKPPIDTRKVVEEVLNEQGREYVGLSAWLAGQAVKHLHMFNEPLDVMELVANPKLGKPVAGQPNRVFSLPDAYAEKYGDRLATRQKETDEKRFNDEVEKRLGEERKKLAGQPFPLRNEAPSVLDVLQTKDGPAAHTLDTATAEYDRLQAARG